MKNGSDTILDRAIVVLVNRFVLYSISVIHVTTKFILYGINNSCKLLTASDFYNIVTIMVVDANT